MRALVIVALALLLAACEREQRTLVQPPKTAETVKTVRMNDLVSGERTSVGNAYERNAQGLALRGFVAAAQNHFSEAITWFDRAIAVDGVDAPARFPWSSVPTFPSGPARAEP